MRKERVTTLELDEYMERCDKVLAFLCDMSDRATHVSYMTPENRKGIDETLRRLHYMIQESSDIYDDLRLISFGSLDVPDYAVREYFSRVEDMEVDCDYIRQDVLAEAKKVMRVV